MTPSSPPTRPTRHGKYYLQEDLITFLVEDQLFRIHRFLFRRESDFFEALFSLTPPKGQEEQGMNDENPLTLPGVTVAELEALLDYSYYRVSQTRSPRDHWSLLLSISTRYDFDEIRENAIRGISSLVPPMDPVRLVELALNHDVGQWLEDAYVSLCTRSDSLTQPEAIRVGPAIAKKVGRCRDEFAIANHDMMAPQTLREKEVARKIVRRVFWPYGPPSM